MKLTEKALAQLPTGIQRPVYDRAHLRQGIVHIGVGGFHRAHQAYYTDRLMNQGLALDWAICGASVRAEDRPHHQALAEQDWLYTLYELGDGNDTEVRVIGAITDWLMAEDDPRRLLDELADPEVRIVSLTITEGGYCIDDSTGQFQDQHPLIVHDLEHPHEPRSVFGFLCAALARRRCEGDGPFTVMSCDNLPHNGDMTRKALLAFARLRDPDLADWIDRSVSFPNAMVDRITPQTSEAHRRQLRERLGLDDNWPVVCEPFVHWVLEDKFCAGRPAWEAAGVQFTDDVTPYEHMKIKLLNGSHMALTYLGFLRGYRFVDETMDDPLFVRFVRQYMDLDVTPQLAPVPGIDLAAYKDSLIERFSNHAIADQLERVCSDGSSKLPKFSVPTWEWLIDAGATLDRAALVVAAWALYLRGVDENGTHYRIPDPRAAYCQAAVADDAMIVQRLLETPEIFGPTLPRSAAFIAAFERQWNRLTELGVERTLQLTLQQG